MRGKGSRRGGGGDGGEGGDGGVGGEAEGTLSYTNRKGEYKQRAAIAAAAGRRSRS